jgi:hypothetical protein
MPANAVPASHHTSPAATGRQRPAQPIRALARRLPRIAAVIVATALLAVAGGSTGRASTSPPPYRLYQPGLAWVPTGYQFKYGDAQSAAVLHPYIDAIRSQVTAVTGVPFGVASTYGGSALADDHVIFVFAEYRPCDANGNFVGGGHGAPGESCGDPSVDGSTLVGGVAYLDSEYWRTDGSLSGYTDATQVKNLVTHEVGHAIGLAHANASGINSTTLDCVEGNDGGEKPIMCSADGHGIGGYTDDRAGEYVQQYDVAGLRAMAANGGATLPAQGPVKGIAGKCLDVDTPGGTDIQNGRTVGLWDCNGMPQQQWIAAPDGTLRALGRCLDDYAAGTTDGNPIVLWLCNGTAWQGWRHNADGGEQNTDPAVAKYLDDKNASTSNGTPVWLYHWTGTAAQIWSSPGGTVPARKR